MQKSKILAIFFIGLFASLSAIANTVIRAPRQNILVEVLPHDSDGSFLVHIYDRTVTYLSSPGGIVEKCKTKDEAQKRELEIQSQIHDLTENFVILTNKATAHSTFGATCGSTRVKGASSI